MTLHTADNARQMTTTYNGYANWSTWNYALWLANDYGVYRTITDAPTLAHAIHEAHLAFPTGTPDMDGDDLGEVDWDEVREAVEELWSDS